MPNPNPKVPPKEIRFKALGIEGLAPGEDSRKIRIRGPVELLDALEELTPKERGRVVGAGLKALGLWQEVEGEA